MRSFIKFFEQKSEEEKNLKTTIDKLPKSHRMLLKNFSVTMTCKNTLKGDDEHIGYISKFDIKVAAPWNYGREFTFLHEVAHLVWEKLITPSQKDEWKKLCKLYNQKPKMNCEEVFCMAYASYFANHQIATYMNPKWDNFFEKLN